jgi:hypothetical protein
MKNKFVNLLFQEPSFSLKVGALILFIMSSLFLYKGLGLKRTEITKLCQDKAMAQELKMQIPASEERIKALEVNKRTSGAKRNESLLLKGILTKGGESAALINDNIYQKNDMISGFIITAITATTVILEDPLTAEQRIIHLPE